MRGQDNLLLTKRFNNTLIWTPTGTTTLLTVHDSSGNAYRVLEIAKHTTVFGGSKLKRNVPLQWLPPPAPGTPQVGLVAPVAVTPSGNVIQHVAAPPPTPKKPAKATKTSGGGTLPLFVSKQLLEFAQMKHEMCPITAEEFITGETAVMPCGHLFMRMAIEETFKKEPNKCPACRQLGAPTYC